MTTLFNRNVSLVVAPANGGTALELNQFHFVFLVQHGETSTPNQLTVRIYNVSDQTAQLLQNAPTPEFSRVVLQVGYQGLAGEQPFIGTIFDGNIKYVLTGHEDAKDSYIEIIAADGDSAYNFAYVNVTLAAGSTVNDHVDAYVSSMSVMKPDGVTQVSVPAFSTTLPRGKVMFGATRDYLRYTAKTTDTTWSIQDGQLQLVPINTVPSAQAIELTSASGLIGFPTITQKGINVRCLINPLIKIGSQINLANSKLQGYHYGLGLGQNVGLFLEAIKTNADGYYRVLWIEHTGDTRGNQWYSDIICVSIDSSYSDPNRTAVAPDNQSVIPR